MASALLESLLDRERAAAANEPDWLVRARAAARAALARDGLPGPRTEAWKYTSLRALERRRFANGDAGAATRAVDPALLALEGAGAARLVFVNGAFRGDLSNLPAIAGVDIATLATAPDLAPWRDALAHDAFAPADAFARLGAALAADGPLIRVAAGTKVADPLHLVFVGSAADVDIAWNARVAVELGEDASLAIVEHHVGDAGAWQLGNLVCDHVLGARARLDLVALQDAGADTTLIRRTGLALAAGAEASLHALEVGAGMARHDLRVTLAGDGARVRSRGVFALGGRQHADTHIDVRHEARDTASDFVWRGVADRRSRGVFHGAITVAPGADGADASLSNKNLLLSADAEIDTQPVLEIHADEVKAAHGATVGRLDENALFYLRSRGIAPESARRLLIQAFASAVLADIEPPPLRDAVVARLAARLPESGAAT